MLVSISNHINRKVISTIEIPFVDSDYIIGLGYDEYKFLQTNLKEFNNVKARANKVYSNIEVTCSQSCEPDYSFSLEYIVDLNNVKDIVKMFTGIGYSIDTNRKLRVSTVSEYNVYELL